MEQANHPDQEPERAALPWWASLSLSLAFLTVLVWGRIQSRAEHAETIEQQRLNDRNAERRHQEVKAILAEQQQRPRK